MIENNYFLLLKFGLALNEFSEKNIINLIV